ncbi:MAG: aldehyde dehydrogenase family protein [Deltaproteobacteria bacterium]|nr:aldehyde dehydrogenase family protein [Deltaproteobacteria bacterium]
MSPPGSPQHAAGAAATSLPQTEGRDVVQRLRRSYESGRTRSLSWRREQLEGLKRMVQEREEEILTALAADLGKPHFEGYAAEVAYIAQDVTHALRHLDSWMKPQRVRTPIMTQPGTCRIVPEPLGVVLIIGPWNYPFSLVMSPLVGALAAGNCALVKPSEIAPETSALIASRLPDYVDDSCIQVVEGGVPETTDLLEQHWDHIFYTGNGQVGRIVMTAAAKHLTPVTLELGGKSPCIIHRDANLTVAARRIAWGKWTNAGQTCVAPDYLLVHQDVHDAFLEELRATVRRFWGDEPQRSEDYGRIVNARHFGRVMKLMDSGDVLMGGQADEDDRYIAPTLLVNVPPDAPVMQEEIFGPILPVLQVEDVDEAIRFINERDKPLALYLFARDEQVQQQVIARTSSGGMTINHAWVHLTVRDLPFGGVGESGMGCYHGKASFDTFTHHKSVLVKTPGIDPPLLYPPYSRTKEKLLKRLL